MAPVEATLAPMGAVGWEDGKKEGVSEGNSGTDTHTQDSLTLLIKQTIKQELSAAITIAVQQIAETHTNLPSASKLTDIVPARPSPSEPELARGILSTWQIVSQQKIIPDRDLAQIEVLINRYDSPTEGHADYWLCRVMWEADRSSDGNEPIRLRVVSGYMRRMEQTGQFSSRVLEDKHYQPGKDVSSRPEPELPGQEQSVASTSASPRTTTQPRVSAAPALPPELNSQWVIEAWRRFAGPNAIILAERAQQLVAVVTRQDVWDAVLANWQTRYGAKANFTHFDGLIETYQREATAKSSNGPIDTFDPNGPSASASVIDQHPCLDSETRAIWYQRLHAAEGKGAKQAIIRRLLAEHPIEPTAY